MGNIEDANELALEASLITAPLKSFASQHSPWEGTASEMLSCLTAIAGEKVAKEKGWPKKPNALSHELRRLAPNLRKIGVDVRLDDSTKKKRLISIERNR